MKNKYCFVKPAFLLIILYFLSISILLAQNETDDSIKIEFNSYGDNIHGWFYKAKGKEFPSTVILLHGYCGKDFLIFELAKVLAENGFNVLTFNYSGTWSSEGVWSPKTSLNNVKSAIDFLKLDQNIEKFSIDTSNISLIGNSYGGGMALLGSLYDNSVRKVCSIAGADLSVWATMYEQDPVFRRAHEKILDRCISDTSRSRGPGGKASYEWLLQHKDEYDIKRFADKLAKKNILLFGGWLDTGVTIEDHILPLYRALQKQKTANLEIHILNDDHELRNVRFDIISKIILWLKK
jgi:dipeptidyl aminopeptidase/acylaminoacyl peptidase